MDAQPGLMDEFLAWCSREREVHEHSLAMMESGQLQTHSQLAGGPMRDTTQESMERDRRIIADMKRLLEAGERHRLDPSAPFPAAAGTEE